MGESSNGVFIVFEGGEGCGKSTQVGLLADRLRDAGHEVVTTFEPGATALGAQIRRLLLGGEDVDARTEALLMAADRSAHAAEVLKPALDRGEIVISDRFVPSSLTYQGVGRDLGVETIGQLSDWATEGLDPDLVLILDIDAATAVDRLGEPTDRMERESADFHDRVRAAYRDLAGSQGWRVVDGSGPPDTVAESVWEEVTPLLS